tara:strand:+ start:248 stop:595 length:348 start_codon:yes stop_codon:yes gene_type:complete
MGGALKSITKPFESAFKWAGDIVAPEIDTSNQANAIREQARQQARQSAESARAAANTQANQSQREQLLRQRDEDSDIDESDADVRVGDDGEFDTARKRRQQFTGSSGGNSASIRI